MRSDIGNFRMIYFSASVTFSSYIIVNTCTSVGYLGCLLVGLISGAVMSLDLDLDSCKFSNRAATTSSALYYNNTVYKHNLQQGMDPISHPGVLILLTALWLSKFEAPNSPKPPHIS